MVEERWWDEIEVRLSDRLPDLVLSFTPDNHESFSLRGLPSAFEGTIPRTRMRGGDVTELAAEVQLAAMQERSYSSEIRQKALQSRLRDLAGKVLGEHRPGVLRDDGTTCRPRTRPVALPNGLAGRSRDVAEEAVLLATYRALQAFREAHRDDPVGLACADTLADGATQRDAALRYKVTRDALRAGLPRTLAELRKRLRIAI